MRKYSPKSSFDDSSCAQRSMGFWNRRDAKRTQMQKELRIYRAATKPKVPA